MSKKNVVALVQARMNSTRLFGKVMKPINGQPMILRVVNALSKSKIINRIIIVTSNKKTDDSFTQFLEKKKIEYFRGSEDDVLARYYEASRKFSANIIVRITGDCPLIDPDIVDAVIKEALNHKVDYVSNIEERTFPRGYDVEVFTNKVMKKLYLSTNDLDDREHVTLYLRRNPQFFKIRNYSALPLKQHPEWRLCVDTKEDLQLVRKIYSKYKKKRVISYNNIISLFENNPELLKINKKIKQKKIKGRIF